MTKLRTKVSVQNSGKEQKFVYKTQEKNQEFVYKTQEKNQEPKVRSKAFYGFSTDSAFYADTSEEIRRGSYDLM